MRRRILSLIIFAPLLITGCQFHDTGARNVVCENYFTLVSDFNHKYPEQGDYMAFLKSGYYETFYYNQENGYNCHYHLEYKDGTVLDEWGNYTSDGNSLKVSFAKIGDKNPVFYTYASPTIDFHIIDALDYEGKEYHIVYQARYLYSAKG